MMDKQEKLSLLDPYYQGIANVTPEIAIQVKARSRGVCEVPGCNNRAQVMHHIIMGRKRRVCVYSIVHLCRMHHIDNDLGCHGYGEGRRLQEMFEETLREKYEELGFTDEQVSYLMKESSSCSRELEALCS